MGVRNRNGEKKIKSDKKKKLAEALREFTRAEAERELANGADPKDSRFTSHANYHVRMKAWAKQGFPIPETEKDRVQFLDDMTRGASLSRRAAMEDRLGFNKEEALKEEKVT